MDGFMGEAIPSDPVQEQTKEQTIEQTEAQAEQQAVQDDKQDSPKAAPAKASSKKESTETAATEQMKSKLDAKRRENVGRPKKGEAAKSAKKPQEIRATFIVDPDLVRKVKYISLVEGILLKDVISEALNNYVDAWEEKNKKIRLPKAKWGHVKTEQAVTACSVLLLYHPHIRDSVMNYHLISSLSLSFLTILGCALPARIRTFLP